MYDIVVRDEDHKHSKKMIAYYKKRLQKWIDKRDYYRRLLGEASTVPNLRRYEQVTAEHFYLADYEVKLSSIRIYYFQEKIERTKKITILSNIPEEMMLMDYFLDRMSLK